tara:strand:+ start:3619 stop:4212 length:594 start_codon:yes stop_codon:yes gene_type:complete
MKCNPKINLIIFDYNFFKRICDFSLALAIIILGFPFFILISLFIIISSKGSPIFIQRRTGYKGKTFYIFKFRSMHINKKRKSAQVYIDNREIFTFGRILRRYKIDEILQVINIIRGEMSFIGPRPHETNMYADMPSWAKKRFETKPGISGLAQVKGGIHINWEKRWLYDIEYVEIKSFIVDLRIIINTIKIILLNDD